MVPSAYQAFFGASVAASSTLVGLLFVSVSVAPERVFGSQGEAVRQARALSAFTALANVFFISFLALIPGVALGDVVVGIAILATLQTLSLLRLARHWRMEAALLRSLFLFVGSTAIYVGEIALGISLANHLTTGALTGLLEVLLGAYAISLGRAWELLGAPRTGILTQILERIERAPRSSDAHPKGPESSTR